MVKVNDMTAYIGFSRDDLTAVKICKIRSENKGKAMESDEKICPFCAETIKAAAVVCKHCGKDLVNSTPRPDPVRKEKKCPYCKENIDAKAKACKFCGTKLVPGFFDGCGTLLIIVGILALIVMRIIGIL